MRLFDMEMLAVSHKEHLPRVESVSSLEFALHLLGSFQVQKSQDVLRTWFSQMGRVVTCARGCIRDGCVRGCYTRDDLIHGGGGHMDRVVFHDWYNPMFKSRLVTQKRRYYQAGLIAWLLEHEPKAYARMRARAQGGC